MFITAMGRLCFLCLLIASSLTISLLIAYHSSSICQHYGVLHYTLVILQKIQKQVFIYNCG